MYCLTMLNGAPPTDPAKSDPDQSFDRRQYRAPNSGTPAASGGTTPLSGSSPGGRSRPSGEVHQQVHVVVLAVELDQFNLEVAAHVPHHLLQALAGHHGALTL